VREARIARIGAHVAKRESSAEVLTRILHGKRAKTKEIVKRALDKRTRVCPGYLRFAYLYLAFGPLVEHH
jgi:hypothetical protein